MKPLLALPLLGLAVGAPAPVFEPLGVCAIDEAGAACWDLRGAPLPALTAQVDRLARTAPQPLGFVYGRKTRYLVVRQGEYRSLSLRAGAGNVQAFPLSGEGPQGLYALRVAAPPEAAAETVVATVGTLHGKPVEAPLRDGAKAVVDGVRIEFGAVKEGPGAGRNSYGGVFRGGFFFPQGRWRFPLERTETTPMGGFAFVPIGHDGKPISFIDANGKPLPNAEAEALVRQPYDPRRDGPFYPRVEPAQVYSSTMGGPSPILWCSTNVDPKAIARLRVQRIAEHTETLGPFPLDPARSP